MGETWLRPLAVGRRGASANTPGRRPKAPSLSRSSAFAPPRATRELARGRHSDCAVCAPLMRAPCCCRPHRRSRCYPLRRRHCGCRLAPAPPPPLPSPPPVTPPAGASKVICHVSLIPVVCESKHGLSLLCASCRWSCVHAGAPPAPPAPTAASDEAGRFLEHDRPSSESYSVIECCPAPRAEQKC